VAGRVLGRCSISVGTCQPLSSGLAAATGTQRWASTFRFSGRTYPELARIVRALCAVAGRCWQPVAAAVAFVPPPEIRALRDLTRTRLQLLKDRTREWQRLEKKLLEGALIKLPSAVCSMARNKTARDILEAIVAGERVPRALAARAHGNIKGGAAAITEALEGMLVGEHHPVLIRVHLDHITGGGTVLG